MAAQQHPTRRIVIGLALVLGILGCLAVLLEHKSAPQHSNDVLPVIRQVADFTLTNQNGQAVSLSDLKGHPWVADIIFTRCAGPCPEMTRKMKAIQDALPASNQARLVTLTTDADYDTPEILSRYADRFGADPARWTFLTGDKVQIAGLAIDSLMLTTLEKKPEERTDPNDLFVHSTIFVVVDQLGRVRAVFETTGDHIDWPAVKEAIVGALISLESEK